MDGKKTGLIVGVVGLVLCSLVGVVSVIAFGGLAYFRGRQAVTSVTPAAITMAPQRNAAAKGFALGARAIADTTLSTFVTDGVFCRWQRVDPVGGQKEDVAQIDGPCSGTRVAWSPDGKKAILWLDPLEDGWKGTSAANGDSGAGGDRLWLVTFATGKFDGLPRAPDGETIEVAFDGEGREVWVTSQEISESDAQHGTTEYHGEKFKLGDGEGLPILAHAFRRESGAWVPIETKVSDDGTDISLGVRVLDTWKTLGPRSMDLLSGQPKTEEIQDEKLLAKLAPIVNPPLEAGEEEADREKLEGEWRALRTDAGPVFVWEEDAEGLFATGLVVFPDGDAVAKAEKLDLSALDAASPMVRGKYLLIAGQDGEQPHLYDIAARKLLWADEKATGTVFWPR